MRLLGSFALVLVCGCSVDYVRLATDGAGFADGVGDTTHDSGGDLRTTDGGSTGDQLGDDNHSGDEHTGDSAHTSDGVSPGDILCPPCAPPPSDNCVGSGPCGCGPYDCPGDADLICGDNSIGWCPGSNLGCECCPAGGPMNNCLCTTTCKSDSDCTDPARPVCNQADDDITGMCTDAEFFCCWMCV